MKSAGESDDLTLSVSYAHVYQLVKGIVEGNPFKLIETLAETISSKILCEFKLVEEIMVRVKKSEAPVPGIFDYFGVEINRSRSGKGIS